MLKWRLIAVRSASSIYQESSTIQTLKARWTGREWSSCYWVRSTFTSRASKPKPRCLRRQTNLWRRRKPTKKQSTLSRKTSEQTTRSSRSCQTRSTEPNWATKARLTLEDQNQSSQSSLATMRGRRREDQKGWDHQLPRTSQPKPSWKLSKPGEMTWLIFVHNHLSQTPKRAIKHFKRREPAAAWATPGQSNWFKKPSTSKRCRDKSNRTSNVSMEL